MTPRMNTVRRILARGSAPLRRYARWLHTRWPAGRVEKLPRVGPNGVTNVPGLRIVGDLTGIPLLKYSLDSGTRAVRAILAEPGFKAVSDDEALDLAIVGAGVSGLAAAREARSAGLRFRLFEATVPFSTIIDFPKRKPIFTYPSEMVSAGGVQLESDVKEDLLEELRRNLNQAQIEVEAARIERVERRSGLLWVHPQGGEPLAARRVILAVGTTGDHRRLGVPGEDLEKVSNRLFDPHDFVDRDVLVVGGGDSAAEAALALSDAGARVTVSYRGESMSRPKAENRVRLERAATDGKLALLVRTEVEEILPDEVILSGPKAERRSVPNDSTFVLIGREAPLDLLRRCGVHVRGDWTWRTFAGLGLFLLFCFFLYNWKSGGELTHFFERNGWFPFRTAEWLAGLGPSLAAQIVDRASFLGTLSVSLKDPSFYYSMAYSLVVLVFGIRRIRRRRTPYVTLQTATLAAIQILPLFLLPYVLLPWAGNNGWFDASAGRWLADHLFPAADYGHGREYWRASGFILAWPLFIWNVFTERPLTLWLAISVLQTFVLIPWIIRRWGKGAYCGWICSCGALAETLGDRHRAKMPHGPFWNRLNMLGQAILAAAGLLVFARLFSWAFPGSALGSWLRSFYYGLLSGWTLFGIPANYYKVVDIFLAGILGVGLYFWFSGRMWCRFACPLAALMHIYTRFSRFRIFAEKEKCISCNVCTTVCHQGIDVMSFANKGLPMEDPECVRCSACVQSCPTGVLRFGYTDSSGERVYDRLWSSPVLMREEGAGESRGR